jgi:hypothetical protein
MAIIIALLFSLSKKCLCMNVFMRIILEKRKEPAF